MKKGKNYKYNFVAWTVMPCLYENHSGVTKCSEECPDTGKYDKPCMETMECHTNLRWWFNFRLFCAKILYDHIDIDTLTYG